MEVQRAERYVSFAGGIGATRCVHVIGSNLFLEYRATAEGVADAQGLGGLWKRRWRGRALEGLLIPSQTI